MTQFTCHHSHHCHLHHFRPVPRFPPVNHLFHVTTLLNEHLFMHFNLLAIHSHEGNWQTWPHLQDVNFSIMSGAGSRVIQLMQNPPVPPLSALVHP